MTIVITMEYRWTVTEESSELGDCLGLDTKQSSTMSVMMYISQELTAQVSTLDSDYVTPKCTGLDNVLAWTMY
ncbi:MAG: hypothetical protein ACOYEQ_05395 [Bacillota bacterium]